VHGSPGLTPGDDRLGGVAMEASRGSKPCHRSLDAALDSEKLAFKAVDGGP
jgi:hypothetical protein